jgi:hypothetical protein
MSKVVYDLPPPKKRKYPTAVPASALVVQWGLGRAVPVWGFETEHRFGDSAL